MIVPARPSNREQLAPPPLRSITGRKYWKGAVGGGVRRLLDWQLEQWGLGGHAALLPFTAQTGG